MTFFNPNRPTCKVPCARSARRGDLPCRALESTGTQNAIPRSLGGLRCEPFGEILRRDLIGGEIELKHAAGSNAMTRRRDSAAPMRVSRARGNLLHQHRFGSERHRRRADLNRRVQTAHLGAHVSQLCRSERGGRRKPCHGPDTLTSSWAAPSAAGRATGKPSRFSRRNRFFSSTSPRRKKL